MSLCVIANMSPLPPIFIKAPRPILDINHNNKPNGSSNKPAQKGNISCNSTPKSVEEPKFWVQCNICQKWRLLPANSAVVDSSQ